MVTVSYYHQSDGPSLSYPPPHAFALAQVLIDYIANIERATEFAERIDQEDVWVMLGKAQLTQMMVKEAIASFIKANDASAYSEVIQASDSAGCHTELATYLVMCRKKVKESHLDTSLIYAYTLP